MKKNDLNQIKMFDWKCQMVSQVVTSSSKNQCKPGIQLDEGDFIVVVGNFKLKGTNITIDMPNFCALHLDMAHKLYLKSDGYLVFKNFKNGRPTNHEELFSFIQDRISNVMSSFTGLEAFLNENIGVIENYNKDYKYEYIDKKSEKKTEKGINKIIDIFTVRQKINVIYDFYEINKNVTVEKNIKKISNLRNKLIHFKRKDTIKFNQGDGTIFDDLLNKDFLDYSILVYEIIDYFIKQSKSDKLFSAYWYKRPDNCFKS